GALLGELLLGRVLPVGVGGAAGDGLPVEGDALQREVVAVGGRVVVAGTDPPDRAGVGHRHLVAAGHQRGEFGVGVPVGGDDAGVLDVGMHGGVGVTAGEGRARRVPRDRPGALPVAADLAGGV